MTAPTTPPETEVRQRETRYWHATRRLILTCLGLWALVVFGGTYFARGLDFRFFGWPFSFWLAAQGSLLFFVALVAWLARRMSRMDREFDVDEQD
jgi:putative solute:sodium symporter small subunit